VILESFGGGVRGPIVLTRGVSDKNSWPNNAKKFRKRHPERLQHSLPFDPDDLPAAAFFAMRTSCEKAIPSKVDG
jgi:hypothetical protein